MKTATGKLILNVRLRGELASRVEKLMKATGRDKTAITVAALEEYVEAEGRQIQEIEEGLAEAERGEFASPEEVASVFAKYGC